MKKVIMILAILLSIISVKAKAVTYRANSNINEEESYNLINIAINQDSQFYNDKYILFQEGDNTYIVIFEKEDYTQTNSTINIEEGKIIESNINGYQTRNEQNIEIQNQLIIETNIQIDNSKANSYYESYRDRKNMIGIGMIGAVVLIVILMIKEI